MACQCSVPGSNATIAVTKDDSIRAFSHRWCKATPTDIKVAPLQRTEITKAIIAQLTTTAKSADAKGFIKLLPPENLSATRWPLASPSYLLETSLSGVFAVNDVRGGSNKRVASAVGEGSIAISFAHKERKQIELDRGLMNGYEPSLPCCMPGVLYFFGTVVEIGYLLLWNT